MRSETDAFWGAELNPEEQDFGEHMMALAGITTQADLLRLGLQLAAKQIGVPIGSQIFALRGRMHRHQKKVLA